MADFKDLSNALADEVLNDIADTFFSARKDIDDSLEYLDTLSKQLLEKVDGIFKSCALLQKVCLGEDGYKKFWELAEINRNIFKFPKQTECSRFEDTPTFSLTSKSEYTKWVSLAYHQLASRIEVYMNGVFTDDGSHHGRKMRSVNFMDFNLFAEEVNRKIDKVNNNTSPSNVLKFAKSLDHEAVEKEKIAGCVGPECAVIDGQMAFKPINIGGFGLPDFPELPNDDASLSFLSDFCAKMYAENKIQVKELLKELRESL
ncbi:hypothetical protein [Desulfovibrio gilichinskyi]|uniref:Uncharacterized protein n=1 Tax=Desulfovibrio gilichinskyi TaxID=1519643 RepID=A0A1X7CBH3_9BACT|nr:hypothetical protein [Desulfovibrio gilichinskyi]SME93014.1 hypothetical protein SAMN06295933_0585 [Desulfovibrio gilichinskyi]